MYKKIISVSSIVVLTLVIISCIPLDKKLPKLNPNNPVAITIWHYYSGIQKDAFDKIVAEFNDSIGREKGIIVDPISQGGVNELADKLFATAKGEPGAGDMPDVFGAYSDTAYDLDALGMVASLDKYLSIDEINEYIEGFVNEARSLPGGQFKIFPIAKSTELLYVNKTDWDIFVNTVMEKDILNKYDNVSDKLLSTWEGIYKAAEVYNKWTDELTPDIPNDGKALFGIDSVANFQFIANKQLGVDLLSISNGKGTVNIDRTAQKRIWNFYYKGMVNGYFAALGRFRSDDVKTGNMLMYIGSSTAGTYMPTKVTTSDGRMYNIKSMILPLPVFEGGNKVAVQQGAGMAVKKSTPEKEYAAVVFLRYFTETKRNIDFVFDSSYLPVKKESIESKELLQKINSLKSSENVQNINISMAIDRSLEQIKNYKMYSILPFAGSYGARKVLESMTSSISIDARRKVLDKIKLGSSMDAAVAEQTSDDLFSVYTKKIAESIEKEIK